MALSRDLIVGEALDLVERDGWESLSMRRLAERLDVWPMAVYRYFRDKDELLAAVAEEAAGRVELPDAGSWRERMSELLGDARRTLVGQPPPRPGQEPGGERMADAGRAILREAGLDDEAAATAWRALFAYALGSASVGEAGGEETRAFEYGLECILDGVEARSG